MQADSLTKRSEIGLITGWQPIRPLRTTCSLSRSTAPRSVFVAAIRKEFGVALTVRDYHEHAVGSGEDATAVAYVEIGIGEKTTFGVGRDRSITTASLRAVVGGLNRAMRGGMRVAVAV